MPLANILYYTSDIDATKSVLTALLGEPHTDTPYYVGFNHGGLEYAINPNGAEFGLSGAVPFWSAADVAAKVEALTKSGATVAQEPTTVSEGVQIAVLKDADGNLFGLITGQ